MTMAIEQRVKYRHNWYVVEAIGSNGYIEVVRDKDKRLIENVGIKADIYRIVRR